ncbi:MAG: hypothetical protein NTZ83_00710 [Candidatus Pacearchaeota archaeon]|nr:hypothetical protein [Candidatus Pacearchaeota archaeon]
MTEFTFFCNLDKFNKKVSKYLIDTLGTPKINLKDKKFESFSYLSTQNNISLDVNILSKYYKKDGKYLLESKAQISVDTINSEHTLNPVIEKLEKMCRE